MENGFVRLPRTWFAKGGVWWKLNTEQRAALATLCSLVAYGEYEYATKGGKVVLEAGQMVTSYRTLAERLELSEMKVRTLVQVLKKEDIVRFEKAYLHTTQKATQLSMLTVNALHDCTTQPITQEKRDNNKNSLKKEIVKKDSSGRFVPPTAEEVQRYLDERGITGFTGADFVAHYEQGGWVYGKNHTPVKSWKACVSTWTRMNKRNDYGKSTTNIYSNGYAGAEERQRIFEQHIVSQLTATESKQDIPF